MGSLKFLSLAAQDRVSKWKTETESDETEPQNGKTRVAELQKEATKWQNGDATETHELKLKKWQIWAATEPPNKQNRAAEQQNGKTRVLE